MENKNIFDRGVAKVKSVVSDTSIEQRDFMKDFIRVCQDGWHVGWHESNGGNLSYRLKSEEVEACRSRFNDALGEWTPLGVRAQSLQGEFFAVTAAGCHFRTLAVDISAAIGIVEINQTGDSWRSVWGFKDGGRPTSEFMSHFTIHAIRKAVSAGTNRVVYHTHPENTVALTAILPLESKRFSQIIWGSLTESVLVTPEGVGVSTWCKPGSNELAEATGALMEKYPAVVWPHHGLLVAANNVDQAFGLTHTIEKAAGIYLKACAATKDPKHIKLTTNEDIRRAATAFGVAINEDFLG